MNLCNFRGRLVADPQVTLTEANVYVCSFTLAVPNRLSKNQEADFIRMVAFGKEGECLGTFAVKGTELIITGRLKSGSYEKDNVKHYTTEIQVSYFEFVSGIKQKEKEEKDNSDNSKKK